ncbi:MAG: hypothetical protein V4475_19855 [Pseudomonadota bacterium]
MARRRSSKRGPDHSGIVWMVGLVALAVAVVAGWWMLSGQKKAHETNELGCLKNGDPPSSVLFMVDTTDRLSPAVAKYVVDTIKQDEARLPQYSRVIIVPFGDDTSAPLSPLFSKCLPGRNAGFDQNQRLVEQAYKEFEGSLDDLQGKLENLDASHTSPISAQIVRAAGDPILKWVGDQRTLVVITDGLESSIYWTKRLRLAPPPAGLLNGVKIEYVELGNAKAARLQSNQMRDQWRGWFEQAGGSVRMTAPGYPAN